MKKLLERINDAIQLEAIKKGVIFPSDESVTVQLILTNDELEKFYDLDLVENCFYEVENNIVSITYSEPDEIFDSLEALKGDTMILNKLVNELHDIVKYDVLDDIAVSEILFNSSISIICNDINYNITFEIIEVDNDEVLNSELKILEVEYI